MKSLYSRLAFLSITMLAIQACCTAKVRIMENDKGNFTAISSSSEESCAYEKAQQEAEEYCKKRHKRFVMVNEKSQYKGMDKNTKGVIKGVGAVLGAHAPVDSQDDNKVTMTFKCK